jgi:hypothetical protein
MPAQTTTTEHTKGIEEMNDRDTKTQVLREVLGLRKLTHTTRMITTRSQNTVLATLNEMDLAWVCGQLLEHEQRYGW